MDIHLVQHLAKEVADVIAPVIPFLVQTTEKVAAGEVVKRVGVAAWEQAQSIWKKLKPKIEEKPMLKETVQDVAQDPENEDAQASLRYQLIKLLKEDITLATELEKILQTHKQVHQFGKYNLNIDTAKDLAIGDGAQVVKTEVGGNVYNSPIATAGRDATVTITTPQSSSGDVRALFNSILAEVRKRPADPDVDNNEIKQLVECIRDEVEKRLGANLNKINRWLSNLAQIAPDVQEAVIETLESPNNREIAEPIRQLAADLHRHE